MSIIQKMEHILGCIFNHSECSDNVTVYFVVDIQHSELFFELESPVIVQSPPLFFLGVSFDES